MGLRYTSNTMIEPIVLILFFVPAALYAAAWIASRKSASLTAQNRDVVVAAQAAPRPDWMLLAAIVLHGVTLAWPWDDGGFRFGFAKALSAMLWIGLVMLWFEGRKVHLVAMRLMMLPLAIVTLLLPLAFPGADFGPLSHRPLFVPHLLAGTLAYGVLMLGALNAVLMLGVQRDLQRPITDAPQGAMSRFLGQLPPLMVLERVLFHFIGVGFVLLLITTLSGMLFSEQVFGRPFVLEHKTIFSLISLAFFGVLLAGRATRGWRGRIAMRFTIGGFVLLLLAYVGSRFVLEVVLHRF
jgi:ABC-type uncharacterized transport system permease subunit